jgi:23S rRNA (cytosine1962-C5)-methyltransferase
LLAKDRDVLNVCSFSGGFSLYAARGGARSITDLDISKHALDSACKNLSLNPWAAKVPHECIQADAFEWLANGPPRGFDLIVCDPPSLARREMDREGAMRAYYALAQSCLRRLNRDGILVTASCSAHVSEHEFMEVIAQAADEHGKWSELWRADHAIDHPATFPEARYLKCIALQVGEAAE